MGKPSCTWMNLLIIGGVIVGLVIGDGWATTQPAQAAGNEVEVLVKFQARQSKATVERFVASYGGRSRAEIARIGVHVLSFPLPAHVGILTRLRADPQVLYAELNGVATIAGLPDDPYYPNQWGLAKIQASQGWDVQTRVVNVVIAIIDTGVDSHHPELRGKLTSGWNYDATSPGYNTADAMDTNGHGTHVAGIAAAPTNNALGVAGTCPSCVIMPIKVLGANNSGTYDAVASGVIFAADHGATIINMSVSGTTFSQALYDAVSYAADRGALVIAAAGNNGTNVVTYPASFPNVLAVAATDSTDQRAAFSNYNTYVSVAAPGSGIYSTLWSSTAGSTYGYKNGTSMATPFVAGLAGLLAAHDPGLTTTQLRAVIEQTADDLGTRGWDAYTGYGRINVARALSGAIAGSVTQATTGVALMAVQVDVFQAGQLKGSTTTDSLGRYRIGMLQPGTYDLHVKLNGYTSRMEIDVLVRVGQESVVNLPLHSVGAIIGKVTTASNRKAIAGATVQAVQGSQVIASATTDTAGGYSIPNLDAGTYDMRATAIGYLSQSTSNIVVHSGQTTANVNFALTR